MPTLHATQYLYIAFTYGIVYLSRVPFHCDSLLLLLVS
jgi:hypothetical protein